MSKILFVDQFAQIGGGQRILLDLVRHFKANRWDCTVALPEDGPLSNHLRGERVAVVRFDLPPMGAGHKSFKDVFNYISTAKTAQNQLAALADEYGSDLVFCNGPRCVLPSVLACRKVGLPMIAAVHLIFQGKEKAMLSWCFGQRCVRAVTFCSQVAAEAFPGLTPEKRALVGNWVSPEFLTLPKSLHAKSTFHLTESEVAVGVVGRLSVHKGQRLFLEAMKPLIATGAPIRLVIAGASDFESRSEDQHLKALARDLGISDRVMFLGSVSNTVALMDALDVLVVPSIWEEPFGLVAVEGMARSLPVVATRSGGLVDIVADGETGYLVDKSAESLREAVGCLVVDSDCREEMGHSGRVRAQSAFSAGPRLETILQLARSALGN